MAAITLIEAITQALAWEMAHDESVIVLGEDVGVNGGVFRATAGLQQRFGAERVLDTPLDETTIAGLTVGLASQGMKPVAEAQFDGFVYPMVDHIVCHAARFRYRTRGRLSCPMVLRVPWGGGIRAPEHHSEANEAIFTNVPGLRVVLPSSPQRAYGMLLAAIRDPDPVIYMAPKRIYRQYKELVPDDGEALPLDVCYVLRDGSDITLVTWGSQVKETLEAADALAKEGVSAEVIDVATLTPLDFDTIAESVAKTGRCVIVHEAARTAGFGAEIAARLAEECMYDLVAPVERVTGYDTHIPLFRLEMKFLPSVEKIVTAAKRALAHSYGSRPDEQEIPPARPRRRPAGRDHRRVVRQGRRHHPPRREPRVHGNREGGRGRALAGLRQGAQARRRPGRRDRHRDHAGRVRGGPEPAAARRGPGHRPPPRRWRPQCRQRGSGAGRQGRGLRRGRRDLRRGRARAQGRGPRRRRHGGRRDAELGQGACRGRGRGRRRQGDAGGARDGAQAQGRHHPRPRHRPRRHGDHGGCEAGGGGWVGCCGSGPWPRSRARRAPTGCPGTRSRRQ